MKPYLLFRLLALLITPILVSCMVGGLAEMVQVDAVGTAVSTLASFVAGTEPALPAAPVGLTASGGNKSVELAWIASSDPNLIGYNIYRLDPPSTFTKINNSLIPNTSFSITELGDGVSYAYVVTAINKDYKESAYSNPAVAVTLLDVNPPAGPTGLNAVTGSNRIHLTWNANLDPDLAGYNVYRNTAQDGPFVKVNDPVITGTTYSDTRVSNGTLYYYVLRAVDKSGNESGNSSPVTATPAEAASGLYFTSSANGNPFVDFGQASGPALQNFTIEAWIKRTPGGKPMSTGVDGLGYGSLPEAYPIITRGRGQIENPSLINMNYWVGIASTGVIAADFQDSTDGWNHPVLGTTPIPESEWHHIAVTFDGACWSLYLDGNVEVLDPSIIHCPTIRGSSTIPAVPASTSVQPAALATALQAGGNPPPDTGFFSGAIDEARIWSLARTGAEIRSTINAQITSGTNLAARWGMGENGGSGIESSLGSFTGSLANGASFGPGAPFNIAPPKEYTLQVNTFGNGTVSLLPPGGIYPAGTVVTLVESPGSGWSFQSWAGDASGTGTIAITMNGNKSVSAVFVESYEVTLTFQQGLNNYAGTIDTFLYEGTPETPYGNEESIRWDISGSVDNLSPGLIYGLLRFTDIFGTLTGQIPPGASIKSAQLDYLVFDPGSAAALHEAQVDWNENITYAGFGGDYGVQPDEYGSPLGAATGSAPAINSVDVTTSLKNWSSNPASNRGWIFIPGIADGVHVRSSEYLAGGLERPRLTVTYLTNIPPNRAPNPPALVQPSNNAQGVVVSPTLEVTVGDPDADTMEITFYGRSLSDTMPPDFTLIAIPDPQNYAWRYPDIYYAQMNWVVANRGGLNIAYVLSLGDNVNNYLSPLDQPGEWLVAKNAWDILTAGGIPYGLVPGNHDGAPSSTGNYNTAFGSRISSQPTYGGRYGTSDYDNTYALFSASGMDFIVVFIEYDDGMITTDHPVLQWANSVLQTNSTRRAIVVSHNLLLGDNFTRQGQAIYDALKGNPNLFLMLAGHWDVAGQRTEVYNGNTVYVLRSDYQTVDNMQSGYLRIMRFSPADDMIYVSTYSPTQGKGYDRVDAAANNFALPYQMDGSNFWVIGTAKGVPSGSNVSASWFGLRPAGQYQWYAVASDGTNEVRSDTWTFTTNP